EAYRTVSKDGAFPANARQIMYAARPEILALTEKDSLDDRYFTQTLLPDYIEEMGVDWNVVFDDCGHFTEPHTDRRFGLGTTAVRNYLGVSTAPWICDAAMAQASVETCGPAGRFGAVFEVAPRSGTIFGGS
ncbi:MAG: hypothetical protein JOZ35_13615, partial [Hyphomicrobiales bacterium]|nr:hypothetical protein [Hyphomicrobiales bacterium]